ncbi:histidine kinase [Chitinophaga pendula]|uniref:sensor histidine kinase n=1 Tax=Chitinophaga TaxID=79328 RepID=UPI0012FE1012|nr:MULTISPECIES: histidine kinase [Chitinophaga]UCJ07385.1 histidine kinase [Chitinophaga pendula]
MRFFKRYIFPALYGLLIYLTIRLLQDSQIHLAFWRRSWRLNLLEMSVCIAISYIWVYLFRQLLRYFDQTQGPLQLGYRRVARELLILVSSTLLLFNLTATPLVAFTDDGLSIGDLAAVNVVPTMFALIYYGIVRSGQFLQAYVDNRLQLERVMNEQLDTELKFLKAQYHPHFLFNAINTVYFQMDEDLPGAKATLEKFSELLRYQLYDQQQQVPVLQEIEYLHNYIGIQKIRSSNRLSLQVDIDPRLRDQLVYPLLFLPLVENAFKYTGGDYQLHITLLLLQPTILIFTVSNSVSDTPPVKEDAGGIGLENLRRRLALLYPGRHQFSIEEQDGLFIASLQLVLTDEQH